MKAKDYYAKYGALSIHSGISNEKIIEGMKEQVESSCETENILKNTSVKLEKLIQSDLKSMEYTNGCDHCRDSERYKSTNGRKTLMRNHNNSYYVTINQCNYLEDSVIGGSTDYSLFGVKLNYCPMCGRKFKEKTSYS